MEFKAWLNITKNNKRMGSHSALNQHRSIKFDTNWKLFTIDTNRVQHLNLDMHAREAGSKRLSHKIEPKERQKHFLRSSWDHCCASNIEDVPSPQPPQRSKKFGYLRQRLPRCLCFSSWTEFFHRRASFTRFNWLSCENVKRVKTDAGLSSGDLALSLKEPRSKLAQESQNQKRKFKGNHICRALK